MSATAFTTEIHMNVSLEALTFAALARILTAVTRHSARLLRQNADLSL